MNKLYRSLAALVLTAVVLAACDDPKDRVRSHIDRGVELIEAGEYDAARLELRNALQIDATVGEAYYHLGRVYDAQRKWPEALRAFGQAVDQSPDHVDANIRLGRYFLLIGEPARALARAEHAIKISQGQNADAFALRAATNLLEDRTKAEIDARKSLSIEPNNEAALATLAGILRQTNRLNEAVAILARGVGSHPDNVTMRLAKIALHDQLEQRDEAELDARNLIDAFPEELRYRVSLARLYITWDRIDDAEALLRESVEHLAGSTDAKLVLVDFLVNQRTADEAENTLRAFVAARPSDVSLQLTLAELLRRGGSRPAAIEILKKALTEVSDPHATTRLKNSLATLQLAEGDSAAARATANDVLRTEPKNATALLIRSRLFLNEGKTTEAIATLRTLLRDNPDSAPGLSMLSRAFTANGQPDLAIDTLRQLVEVDADNTDAGVRLARVLGQSGQIENALSHVNEALEKSPNHIAALSTKADLLLALGRVDEARAVNEKIVNLPGAKTTALKLEGRIERISGNPAGALEAFQQVRELDAKDWSAVNGIVLAYAGLKEPARAVEFLQDVVAEQPDNQLAWIRLGDLHRAAENQSQAIAAYEKAIGINPAVATPHRRLVQYYYALEKPALAIASLRKAVASNPDDVSFKLPLAIALTRAQQFDAAIGIYEELVASGERSTVVLNNLAALIADHAHADREKMARALDLVRPLEGSNNAHVLDTIGWLNFRAGNMAVAISLLKRAHAFNANIPIINYHLGRAYYDTGQEDLARQHLSSAIAESGDAAGEAGFIEQANQLLEELRRAR